MPTGTFRSVIVPHSYFWSVVGYQVDTFAGVPPTEPKRHVVAGEGRLDFYLEQDEPLDVTVTLEPLLGSSPLLASGLVRFPAGELFVGDGEGNFEGTGIVLPAAAAYSYRVHGNDSWCRLTLTCSN